MFSTRNERLGLLVATALFALLGILQLCRALANVPVSVGGSSIPIWASVIAAIVMLGMAVWLGALLNRRRPLV